MKPKSETYSGKAVRIFTDRESPRAAFWDSYRKMKEQMQTGDADICVLHYYGVGGIGKSTLLSKLIDELCENINKPRYVQVDFSVTKDSRQVLSRMAEFMTRQYGFSFPQFDIANLTYAKHTYIDFTEKEVQQFCQKSPFLRLTLKTLDILTGSVATKIIEIADDIQSEVRTYLKHHAKNIRQMDHMGVAELYGMLPYYFAMDMKNNLKNHTEPFVFFLDTYEAMVNELSSVGNPLTNDLWLRGENGLIQWLPNVIWVIGGRDKLKWETFDADWSEALEQHLLGNLSDVDSDSFLQNAGVKDETLRKQLYRLTGGTPCYLDLCMDRYDAIIKRGETPRIEMFGNTPEELVDRLVCYMDDRMQDFVYFLTCLECWDDQTASEIAPNVLLGFPHTLYERIKGLSFISEVENGFFVIHPTVREVLATKCPLALQKKTGEVMQEYFFKQLPLSKNPDETYALRLLQLVRSGWLLGYTREQFYQFFIEKVNVRFQWMVDAGLYSQLDTIWNPLYQYASEQTNDLLFIVISNVKGYLLWRQKLWEEAYHQQKETLSLATDILGENHDETLTALGNLANTLHAMDQYDDALSLQLKCLRLQTERTGEEHPKTLVAKQNLATTIAKRKTPENLQKAAELLREVVETGTKYYGEQFPFVMQAKENLATVFEDMGDHEEALSLHQKVFEKQIEVLGEKHSQTLITKSNLAACMADLEKPEEALALYCEVFEQRKEVLGECSEDTLRTMENVALTLEDLGRIDEACEWFQKALTKRRQTFGDYHPQTLEAIESFAIFCGKNGRKELALQLHHEALSGWQSVFGAEHPIVFRATNNLAYLLVQQKEYAEAEDLLCALLSACEAYYEDAHPAILYTAEKYYDVLIKSEQYDKANQIAEQYHIQ